MAGMTPIVGNAQGFQFPQMTPLAFGGFVDVLAAETSMPIILDDLMSQLSRDKAFEGMHAQVGEAMSYVAKSRFDMAANRLYIVSGRFGGTRVANRLGADVAIQAHRCAMCLEKPEEDVHTSRSMRSANLMLIRSLGFCEARPLDGFWLRGTRRAIAADARHFHDNFKDGDHAAGALDLKYMADILSDAGRGSFIEKSASMALIYAAALSQLGAYLLLDLGKSGEADAYFDRAGALFFDVGRQVITIGHDLEEQLLAFAMNEDAKKGLSAELISEIRSVDVDYGIIDGDPRRANLLARRLYKKWCLLPPISKFHEMLRGLANDDIGIMPAPWLADQMTMLSRIAHARDVTSEG